MENYYISWPDLAEATGLSISDLRQIILEGDIITLEGKQYEKRGDVFVPTKKKKQKIYIIPEE